MGLYDFGLGTLGQYYQRRNYATPYGSQPASYVTAPEPAPPTPLGPTAPALGTQGAPTLGIQGLRAPAYSPASPYGVEPSRGREDQALAEALGYANTGVKLGSGAANLLGYSGVGGGLGALSGAYGLYSGIENENYLQAAQGGLGALQGANAASGALGGPTLSSVAGPAAGGVASGALGALGGAYGVYSGIENENAPQVVAGGLAATGGALSAASAAGLVGAGAAAVGGALTGVGAVLALTLVIDMLGKRGGPLSTYHEPTSSDISKMVANTGIHQFNTALSKQTSVSGLAGMLGAKWSPHGEVLLSSTPTFGGQGDWQTPPSEMWSRALSALSTPALVAQGLPWVEEFVRGLSIKYGQTGAADTPDPEAVWKLQSRLAKALPNIPAYEGLKRAVAPGGDLWAAEQARLNQERQSYAAARPITYDGLTGARGVPVAALQAALGEFGATGTPSPLLNTWDPYTDTGITPDGRTFQLNQEMTKDYLLNPYTYDPYYATYGPAYDPSLNQLF